MMFLKAGFTPAFFVWTTPLFLTHIAVIQNENEDYRGFGYFLFPQGGLQIFYGRRVMWVKNTKCLILNDESYKDIQLKKESMAATSGYLFLKNEVVVSCKINTKKSIKTLLY